MNSFTFGDRVREERNKLHLSQAELAEKIHISTYYMGELERGEKIPSVEVLLSLADALAVSCDYLLRDHLKLGSIDIAADIVQKISVLSPKQRQAAEAILDAYIEHL